VHQLWSAYDRAKANPNATEADLSACLDDIEREQNLLEGQDNELIRLRDRFFSVVSYERFLEESIGTPFIRSNELKKNWAELYAPFYEEREVLGESSVLEQYVPPPLNALSPVWQKIWLPYFREPKQILTEMKKALEQRSPLLFYVLVKELQQSVYADSYARFKEKIGGLDLTKIYYQWDFSLQTSLNKAIDETVKLL
jgi:hypothetical protein